MIHESLLINEFVIDSRKERYHKLIASPKGRIKFRKYIAHFADLDLTQSINVNSLKSSEQLIELLALKSSIDSCYIVSEHSDYDMKVMPLREAIEKLFHSGISFFLSCIPGKLVYYEGEDFNTQYLFQK